METIKYSEENGVLVIELHRPEVHNAINFKMMDELESIIRFANQEEQIRVIVVRGSGDKTYAAGGDLAEFHNLRKSEEAYGMLKRMALILEQISASPKITIAAINGLAIGGGAELTTAFDIRIAANTAKIGFVQSKLGLTTGWGGGTRLLNLLGPSHSMALLYLGEVLPVQKWYELGYIQQIFPPDNFNQEIRQFANRYTEISPSVVHAYKRLRNSWIEEKNMEQHIEQEIVTCAKLWEEEEHLQAVDRFLNKNK